jgi:curved DNA-binding protein CbpA
MNYYEELGIRPDADQEEIRKSHRRLVRLMHPDKHRDPAMKQLGEMQMRRLNSIVATLLDSERRREYDVQLRSGFAAAPVGSTAWHKMPWWIASTAGAVVLTVGAVWFGADHLGSSFQCADTGGCDGRAYGHGQGTTAAGAGIADGGFAIKLKRDRGSASVFVPHRATAGTLPEN